MGHPSMPTIKNCPQINNIHLYLIKNIYNRTLGISLTSSKIKVDLDLYYFGQSFFTKSYVLPILMWSIEASFCLAN
jgi:hypothetical protein